MLGLQGVDVDLAGGTLSVRRGLQRVEGHLQTFPTKTRRAERTIPLPAMVIAALDAHRHQQIAELREFDIVPSSATFVSPR